MNSNISIVIPSYKSGKLIISHLKRISKKIKVIIVENSKDKKLKKEIETKHKNVRVYLQNNIGYGNAINYGSKFVKTKYFFVMNPDTIIYKNTIKNLLIEAKKIKYFGALSPDQIKNKKINLNKKKKIIEKNQLDGGAMLFETLIFKNNALNKMKI